MLYKYALTFSDLVKDSLSSKLIRITTDVDKGLQEKAKEILLSSSKKIGDKIPFEYGNKNYVAIIEMHAANERVDHPHPGVSLFEVKRELSERSKKKIAELIPEFRTQVEQLMLQGLAAGLRPEIVEARRSQDRQNELYEQGRTKPGAIVTWTKDSAHTRGEAVDIAQLDENGNITYKTTGDFYPKMGAIGKSLGMIWGGDWKGKTDLPHFQYAKKS
jgi:hypothetical protein